MTTDKYPKFLPQWTNAVEHICGAGVQTANRNTMKVAKEKFGLDWYSSTCCLTGEAFFHERADKYCNKCEFFTFDRAHSALETRNGLYEYKKDLAEHLQKSHPQVWEQWKEKMK